MATIKYHDKPVHYRVLFADPALPYGVYDLTCRSRRVYHYAWLVVDRTSGYTVRGFSEHWFNAKREANYHARFFPSPNIHVQEIPQA